MTLEDIAERLDRIEAAVAGSSSPWLRGDREAALWAGYKSTKAFRSWAKERGIRPSVDSGRKVHAPAILFLGLGCLFVGSEVKAEVLKVPQPQVTGHQIELDQRNVSGAVLPSSVVKPIGGGVEVASTVAAHGEEVSQSDAGEGRQSANGSGKNGLVHIGWFYLSCFLFGFSGYLTLRLFR